MVGAEHSTVLLAAAEPRHEPQPAGRSRPYQPLREPSSSAQPAGEGGVPALLVGAGPPAGRGLAERVAGRPWRLGHGKGPHSAPAPRKHTALAPPAWGRQCLQQGQSPGDFQDLS